MEHSEIKERVINLGKLLVQELGLEPGVDTLSRWMAHYISEQMAVTENAEEDEKTMAEKECFETILKLWEHRALMPDGHRPFENFEPIFRALNALDPENRYPYFYNQPPHRSSKQTKSEPNEDTETEKWINIAHAFDSAARVLINYALTQAAKNACDEKTTEWLKESRGIDDEGELSLISRMSLIMDNGTVSNEDRMDRQKKLRIDNLSSRIQKLESFMKSASLLLADFRGELAEAVKEDG